MFLPLGKFGRWAGPGLLLLLWAACVPMAEDAAAYRFHSDWQLRYDAGSGAWSAQVRVDERDTAGQVLPFFSSKPILFQGQAMLRRYAEGRGLSHHLEGKAGAHPAVLRFAFEDHEGRSIGYEGEWPGLVAERIGADSLRWDGPPLREGEALLLLWRDAAGALHYEALPAGQPGSLLALPLPARRAPLQVLRRADWRVQQARADYRIRCEYAVPLP